MHEYAYFMLAEIVGVHSIKAVYRLSVHVQRVIALSWVCRFSGAEVTTYSTSQSANSISELDNGMYMQF